jgi:hypothetical protein
MQVLESLLKSSFLSITKKHIQKEVTFTIGEVHFLLSQFGKPKLKLYITKYEGEHFIYPDNSSDTRVTVKNLTIINMETNNQETLFSPVEHQVIDNFEDKMDLCTFRKRDSYLSVGTDTKWYTLDYLELNLLPVKINIAKSQIEFIVDFFFGVAKQEKLSEEESRNLLMSTTKFQGKKKKEEIINNKQNIEAQVTEEDLSPIFFRLVKINETQIILNIHLSDLLVNNFLMI